MFSYLKNFFGAHGAVGNRQAIETFTIECVNVLQRCDEHNLSASKERLQLASEVFLNSVDDLDSDAQDAIYATTANLLTTLRLLSVKTGDENARVWVMADGHKSLAELNEIVLLKNRPMPLEWIGRYKKEAFSNNGFA